MRGEVVSLSRNIKIIGEDVDSFGCQILSADIMEDGSISPDTVGLERTALTQIDSIEI